MQQGDVGLVREAATERYAVRKLAPHLARPVQMLVPAGSRAYATSLLAMAAALGAGFCVMALPLADLGHRSWRLVYLVPLLGLVLVPGIARRLPESRRFVAPHAQGRFRGHQGRLVLLAVSGLLVNVFVAPASSFQNACSCAFASVSMGKLLE